MKHAIETCGRLKVFLNLALDGVSGYIYSSSALSPKKQPLSNENFWLRHLAATLGCDTSYLGLFQPLHADTAVVSLLDKYGLIFSYN